MAFCSGCSLHRGGRLVPTYSFSGANEPTGACGRRKFPCIAFAGHSVGSGPPILHAFRAALPIARPLISPGRLAPYLGGPLFGTNVVICSKTLLCVMLQLPQRMETLSFLSKKCDVCAFLFSDHLAFDGPCHNTLHHVFLYEE